ncbi:MAG TPA: di-/tricarboxylate transporter [Firmicutes bacterium]|jgi:di/tricarboxylate transporter|nr:di-/tricarboxylate transporter [Bacillota bacterium]
MNLTMLVISAIIVAIALGFVFKINVGLLAIVFSYIIGAFFMGLKTKDIILMWPTNLFWMILTITFFYGFAMSNGTLSVIARKTVFASRKYPYLIPITLYILTLIISGIGPGAIAVFALMSPLIMAIVMESNISPILGATIIICGGSAGGWSPIAVNGVVTRGVIETAGYGADSSALSASVFSNMLIVCTIVFILAYFILGGYKAKALNMETPPDFNRDQIINIYLIATVLLVAILPQVLAVIFPASKMLAFLKNQIEITFIAVIGSVIAMFYKIGNEKDVISKVPWGIIVLICGTGMLISVAVAAGTITTLSAWMGNHVSAATAPIFLSIVSGVMSIFSSTLGVVIPTLYPMVPGVIEATGNNPGVLFSIIAVSSVLVAYSPFSTAGALAVAAVADEAKRKTLFNTLLIIPFITLCLNVLFVVIGVIY